MGDLLVDENNDLRIENGDFIIGDGTEQHVLHILEAHQGEYKNAPLLGVFISRLKGGVLNNSIKRRIKLQLQSQGIELDSLQWDGEKLEVQIKS